MLFCHSLFNKSRQIFANKFNSQQIISFSSLCLNIFPGITFCSGSGKTTYYCWTCNCEPFSKVKASAFSVQSALGPPAIFIIYVSHVHQTPTQNTFYSSLKRVPTMLRKLSNHRMLPKWNSSASQACIWKEIWLQSPQNIFLKSDYKLKSLQQMEKWDHLAIGQK